MKTRRRKGKRQSRTKSRKPYKGMRGGAPPTDDANPFVLREPEDIGPVVYSPVTVTDMAIPDMSQPELVELTRSEIPVVTNEYIDKQNDVWKRYVKNGSSATPQKSVQITVDKCSSYLKLQSDEGQGGFDRLCIILKQTTSKITVFPAVNGNLENYTKCINYIIEKSGDTNAVYIFASPMFSYEDTALDTNKKILNHFMKFKRSYKNEIYILTEFTQNSIRMGCKMSSTDSGYPILTLLEPTYIIYPFPVFIGKNAKSGILFSAAAANEAAIPLSPTVKLFMKDASKLGVFTAIKLGIRGGIAFPPDITSIDAGIAYSKPEYICYRTTTITDSTSDTGIGTSTLPSDTYKVFNMIDLDTRKVREFPTGSKFIAAPSAELLLDGIPSKTVPLGEYTYSLRQPSDAGVQRDWRNLNFTDDEARFLNDLKLRPYILDEIFGKGLWAGTLASFMENIVRSKCFTDSRLVLNYECRDAQKFITKVLEYFIANEPRIAALESEEELARNRGLKLKVEKAIATASSTAEDNAASTASMKFLLEAMGNPTADVWKADPFATDIEFTNADVDENEDYGVFATGDRFSRVIVVIDKVVKPFEDIIPNKTRKGYIHSSKVDTPTFDLATEKLESMYDAIKKKYPRYNFQP